MNTFTPCHSKGFLRGSMGFGEKMPLRFSRGSFPSFSSRRSLPMTLGPLCPCRGSSLLLVLFMCIVVTGLIGALYVMCLSSSEASQVRIQYARTLEIPEAGGNRLFQFIRQTPVEKLPDGSEYLGFVESPKATTPGKNVTVTQSDLPPGVAMPDVPGRARRIVWGTLDGLDYLFQVDSAYWWNYNENVAWVEGEDLEPSSGFLRIVPKSERDKIEGNAIFDVYKVRGVLTRFQRDRGGEILLGGDGLPIQVDLTQHYEGRGLGKHELRGGFEAVLEIRKNLFAATALYIDGTPDKIRGGFVASGFDHTIQLCPVCNGNGWRPPGTRQEERDAVTCPDCGGTGTVTRQCPDCKGVPPQNATCPDCNGIGKMKCPQCNNGKIDCPRCVAGKIPDCPLCHNTGHLCPVCGGTGKMCARCGGSGKITCPKCGGTTIYNNRSFMFCNDTNGVSPNCGGDGLIPAACPRCNGIGRITPCPNNCVNGIKQENPCTKCAGTKRVTNDASETPCGETAPPSQKCNKCKGTGIYKGSACSACKVCPRCGGTGVFQEPCTACKCPVCGGTGDGPCPTCSSYWDLNGNRLVDENERTIRSLLLGKLPCNNGCDATGKVSCPDCKGGTDAPPCPPPPAGCGGTGGPACPNPPNGCGGFGGKTCPDCNGVGSLNCTYPGCTNGYLNSNCPTCKGTGKVSGLCPTCHNSGTITTTCPTCAGKKAVIPCSACGGDGSVRGTKNEADQRITDGTGTNVAAVGYPGDLTDLAAASGGDATHMRAWDPEMQQEVSGVDACAQVDIDLRALAASILGADASQTPLVPSASMMANPDFQMFSGGFPSGQAAKDVTYGSVNHMKCTYVMLDKQNNTMPQIEGAGVLIIDAASPGTEVKLDGQFQWTGLVIVLTSCKVTGSGGADQHIMGSLMCAEMRVEGPETFEGTGNGGVSWSQDAMNRATSKFKPINFSMYPQVLSWRSLDKGDINEYEAETEK